MALSIPTIIFIDFAYLAHLKRICRDGNVKSSTNFTSKEYKNWTWNWKFCLYLFCSTVATSQWHLEKQHLLFQQWFYCMQLNSRQWKFRELDKASFSTCKKWREASPLWPPKMVVFRIMEPVWAKAEQNRWLDPTQACLPCLSIMFCCMTQK